MKYFTFLILTGFLSMLMSCGGDDDICESGEGTPRMKVSFKNTDGKETVLDSIYVAVDYGSGKVQLGGTNNATSRLIPLRVDDSPSTDVYFRLTNMGQESHIKINYTTKSTYVSPGCGVKKNYENLSSELITPTPVVSLEPGQNFIDNEDKTSLYLIFQSL
ncbi:hypothetical protein ACM39_15160 [Chryseobacterium sp. FH2]|uniref:hypothetical protein n=1 Tax=Chryseobacterium sp. FH2 TaxID=1674291 RepID=UPI00065ABC61|nr:hypothetical protein [Chryseobacterium sp. FH2]KMQ67116.1 hypothetical protein ACM39_15160 [Chryseobacterium sp. FH2]